MTYSPSLDDYPPPRPPTSWVVHVQTVSRFATFHAMLTERSYDLAGAALAALILGSLTIPLLSP